MNFDQGLFSLPAGERKLLAAYRKLDAQGKQSLGDYAAWLAQREAKDDEPEEGNPVAMEPVEHPRPEEESVVKAVKRLSATYPMVDKNQLFNKTSSLMTQHIMQGRASADVIDELEVVFLEAYNKLKDETE